MIGVGAWLSHDFMEKHLDSTRDGLAISRPVTHEAGLVSKWIQDPKYFTQCVYCRREE